MNLKIDTILITGGASGIGLELARQLMALGNRVIITGRDIEKLEAIKMEYPAIEIYQSDVSDINSVKELYQKVTSDFPKINIVINNAGIMRSIDFLNVECDKVCEEIDINLNGTINMAQAFLPHLLKQEKSAIINVSSGLAFVPFEKTPIYCVSKAGVHTYTKVLRAQLKNTSVKVIEIAPPKTSAPMFERGINESNRRNSMVEIDVPKLVEISIKNIKSGKLEIKPRLSKALKFVGRFLL